MAFYAPIGYARFARYCDLQNMENVLRFHYSIPVISRIDRRETQYSVIHKLRELYNSDYFILIAMRNQFINKLGRALTERKRRKDTLRKRTCKGTMPLMLKSDGGM